MSDHRYLRQAAALVGLLIVAFTALDYGVSVWPVEIGSLSWRFNAMTALGGSLLTPALGMLLLFAAATGSRRWPRFAISGFLAGLGLVLVTGIVVFVLDVLQLRVGVRPEVMGEYDVATGRTLAKLSLGGIATLVFSLLAFKAARGGAAPRERQKHHAPGPLIPGRAGQVDSQRAGLQSSL